MLLIKTKLNILNLNLKGIKVFEANLGKECMLWRYFFKILTVFLYHFSTLALFILLRRLLL